MTEPTLQYIRQLEERIGTLEGQKQKNQQNTEWHSDREMESDQRESQYRKYFSTPQLSSAGNREPELRREDLRSVSIFNMGLVELHFLRIVFWVLNKMRLVPSCNLAIPL